MAAIKATSIDQLCEDLNVKRTTPFTSKDGKHHAFIVGVNITKNEAIMRVEPGSKIISVPVEKLAVKPPF